MRKLTGIGGGVIKTMLGIGEEPEYFKPYKKNIEDVTMKKQPEFKAIYKDIKEEEEEKQEDVNDMTPVNMKTKEQLNEEWLKRQPPIVQQYFADKTIKNINEPVKPEAQVPPPKTPYKKPLVGLDAMREAKQQKIKGTTTLKTQVPPPKTPYKKPLVGLDAMREAKQQEIKNTTSPNPQTAEGLSGTVPLPDEPERKRVEGAKPFTVEDTPILVNKPKLATTFVKVGSDLVESLGDTKTTADDLLFWNTMNNNDVLRPNQEDYNSLNNGVEMEDYILSLNADYNDYEDNIQNQILDSSHIDNSDKYNNSLVSKPLTKFIDQNITIESRFIKLNTNKEVEDYKPPEPYKPTKEIAFLSIPYLVNGESPLPPDYMKPVHISADTGTKYEYNPYIPLTKQLVQYEREIDREQPLLNYREEIEV